MGLRFRKSVKILPGVRVNFNKNSTSISVGRHGARYTVSSNGKKTATVGIPGTGLSYSASSKGHAAKNKEKEKIVYSNKTYNISGKLLYALAILALLIGIPTFIYGGFIFVIMSIIFFMLGKSYIKKSEETKENTESIL